MTPARTCANGVRTPSPLQLLLIAMLRLFAELVSSVAAMFGMKRRPEQRDWHTPPPPSALPRTERDTSHKETITPLTGLMLSLSKHEAVLTTSHPAPASFDKLRMRRSPAMCVTPKIVIPDAREAREPEPRGSTHSQPTQPLPSRSRVPRAGNDTTALSPSAPA